MSVPAFWPMVMATELTRQGLEAYARNLRFVEEEIKIHEELRPQLATPHRVRLDLRTMKLCDYGGPDGLPTLVDAPYAGHTAVIADYRKGQSLVETLLAAGCGRVLLTDWTYLLAGASDDITTPEQVLRAENYLGTPRPGIVKQTAPGGHIGLFMGTRTLRDYWPAIGRWIADQSKEKAGKSDHR